MKLVRCCPLKKYNEFIISGSLFSDGISLKGISNEYVVGIDFARDSNIFCSYDELIHKYKITSSKDFDKYNVVCRILNWNKNIDIESYTIRILKTNKNDKVDFEEEKRHIESVVWSSYEKK